MQANIAIGLMETSSIAKGIEALDAMCKAAGVKPEVHQAISKGKYIIVISGPVGEVFPHRDGEGRIVEVRHAVGPAVRAPHRLFGERRGRGGEAGVVHRDLGDVGVVQEEEGGEEPAAGPSRCAMIPPPAAKMRSGERSAAQVSWTWSADWPEEKTGMTTAG